MARTSIPLPTELVEMVIEQLPRRQNLWSLSLVCRRLNLLATPHLYKTVILELQEDISIGPCLVNQSWPKTDPSTGKTGYLLRNPGHPKAHLVRDVGIVAIFDSGPTEREGVLLKRRRAECASFANEMMIGFIQSLRVGQLRTFV
ncbi:hypothetical protein TWF481_004239 [Arthrobotrys musiformis]|uniref:F-box domain-containing protein n=1 Tax=Arthrobotrys musiformis TaxID=47236 RepID=A0AAV9WK26_9PEZI